MEVTPLTVADVVNLAGATTVTAILSAVILNALSMPQATRDRFGPLLTIIIGIFVVELATWALVTPSRQDIVQAGLTGILAGSAGIGFKQILSSAQAAVAKP